MQKEDIGGRVTVKVFLIRDLVAFWYTLCYRQGPGPRIGFAEIRAWTLPVAAARLAGRVAENEAVLRAEVERLAAEERG